MELDLESLMKEGQQFFQLRKGFQRSVNPTAGSSAYLISKTWIDKYKKYLFYNEISRTATPVMEADHCKKTYPGPITNKRDLLEDDDKFLKGTGTVKGFETEVIDTYLKKDVRENLDFEFCN